MQPGCCPFAVVAGDAASTQEGWPDERHAGAEALVSGSTSHLEPPSAARSGPAGVWLFVTDGQQLWCLVNQPCRPQDPASYSNQQPDKGCRPSPLHASHTRHLTTPHHTHRTQTQAKKAQAATKKAVTHVKEVAHELHVKEVLAKHKLPFDAISPSGRAAAEGGPQAVDTPRPLLDLLRRSTAEVRKGRPVAATLLPHIHGMCPAGCISKQWTLPAGRLLQGREMLSG